ncbi:hypothetical protein [Caulobacter sp. DWP3-1-3b2]|uniref:hypothetical protein n=1 Tax=Caulobacter sp. DWP3-1-3b2 TaxID=2804643 RepID=UPI003CEF989D
MSGGDLQTLKRALLIAACLVALPATIYGFSRYQAYVEQRPIRDAKALLWKSGSAILPGLQDQGAFEVEHAHIVCGTFRTKDFSGKFMPSDTYIVWFQTVDGRRWRDPVFLKRTQIMTFSDDPTEIQRQFQDKAATNDYYRFVPICQAEVEKQ